MILKRNADRLLTVCGKRMEEAPEKPVCPSLTAGAMIIRVKDKGEPSRLWPGISAVSLADGGVEPEPGFRAGGPGVWLLMSRGGDGFCGLQQHGASGIQPLGNSLSFIQPLQVLRGDCVKFAVNRESFGPFDKAGVAAEVKQTVERLGACCAEILSGAQQVMQSVTAFE